MRNENEKIFLRCNPIKTIWKDSAFTHCTSLCPLRLFTLSHPTSELQVLLAFFTVNINEFSNSLITINFKMFLQYFLAIATSVLPRIKTKVALQIHSKFKVQ